MGALRGVHRIVRSRRSSGLRTGIGILWTEPMPSSEESPSTGSTCLGIVRFWSVRVDDGGGAVTQDSLDPVDRTGLVAHLERHLGRIVGGWGGGQEGAAKSLQVVSFEGDASFYGTPLSTLGLSHHLLTREGGSRGYRLELVTLCEPGVDVGRMTALMDEVASELLAAHRVLLRGDVVGPRGPLVEGSTVSGLYCTVPVFLAPGARQFADVAIVWLIPVTSAECSYIAARGWSAFEEALDVSGFVSTDLFRQSVAGDG